MHQPLTKTQAWIQFQQVLSSQAQLFHPYHPAI